MAASKSLHNILDSLERANKKDCIDFTHGHLNENKLIKFAEKSNVRSWPSAHKEAITTTPRSQLIHHPVTKKPDVQMQNTQLKFHIDPSHAMIPVPPTGKKPEKSRSAIRKKPEGQSSCLDDDVLIDEFVSQVIADELKLSARFESAPTISQDLGHNSITKRDQYFKRQTLETDIIRKQDAREQNVLSGFKAVEQLEHKLKRNLDELGVAAYGPNFHRLQIYGDIFNGLISESRAFGPALRTIKKEYDDYTTYLLDSNPTQHQLLQEQILQMKERKVTTDSEFEDEKQRLFLLELEAEKLLAVNKRLREQLDREKRGDYTPVKSPLISKPEKTGISSPRGKSITDRVQNLRTGILEYLDEIQSLRNDLRQNYVPISVVNQLEQCVKENEIENQNLARKNEALEKDIAEVVEHLANEIQAADTNESDERRIWRRLLPGQMGRASTSQSSSGGSMLSTRAVITPSSRSEQYDLDSESDDEDESKWNWYIS